jgi:hypothetical protein
VVCARICRIGGVTGMGWIVLIGRKIARHAELVEASLPHY